MDPIERAYTQHAKDVYRYLLSLSHDEEFDGPREGGYLIWSGIV